jgi:PPOX class probable F420-dependent enzyme
MNDASADSQRDLELVRRLAAGDHHWAVVSTARRDGSVQSTVVTAGVMDHPLTGQPTVAFVTRGDTVKRVHLRRDPRATVTFRAGREWVTVEGHTSLLGPADTQPGFGPKRVPQLLRDVFTAAGGTHPDWAEFDRVMAAERRTAVFVTLDRVYTNGGRPR